MGGKDQEYIIGYSNWLGMHTVAALAPVDGISAIKFDDRIAWEGPTGSAQIQVFAPELFGGRQREGGVAGHLDYLAGTPSQAVNDYLLQVLGSDSGTYSLAAAVSEFSAEYNPGLVPAFRGTAGLVWRQFGFGNNPYIKRLSERWHNINSTYPESVRAGDWYPEFAPICPEVGMDNVAIYVAIDRSGSFFSPESKGINEIEALKSFVSSLTSIGINSSLRLQTFTENDVGGPSIEFIPFTADDISTATEWLDALALPGGLTNFQGAVAAAPQFFIDSGQLLGADSLVDYEPALTGPSGLRIQDANLTSQSKSIIFISDGFPTVGGWEDAQEIIVTIPNVSVFCIGVDVFGNLVFLDNTPSDGVPVVNGQGDYDDAFANFLQAPYRRWADLNAAHILRDMLLDPACQGSGNPADIGDSFPITAELFFNEGMGFSFRWLNLSDRDSFKKLVEQHANCVVYEGRATGKWEIKPIRPDYVFEDLFVFDNSNVLGIVNYDRPLPIELPNHIVLVYTRRENGETASISDTNNAAIQLTTEIIPDRVEMLGVTCPTLASKILQRELQARTQPIGQGSIRVAYLPTDLDIGHAFVLNMPRAGINNVVMRITEIEETDGKDNAIVLNIVEDVFQYNAVSAGVVAEDPPLTGRPTTRALPTPYTFAEELSYFDLISARGEDTTADLLAADPDFGAVHVTAARPDPYHVTGVVATQSGSSWIRATTVTLAPTWTLVGDVTRLGTEITFQAIANGRESELRAGQIIQIGDERMRLDNVTIDYSTALATFTVGRGILDTVPDDHFEGATIIAWPTYTGSDSQQYTAGETVSLRVLPAVSRDTLNINDASTEVVSFDSRAIRPYPVAGLRVDGLFQSTQFKTGTVTVTWTGRNRLTQTSVDILDYDDASIAVEAGVSFHLIRRWIELESGVLSVGYTLETPVSPETALTTTFDAGDPAMSDYITENTTYMEVGVVARRDGYDNWQTPFVIVYIADALDPPYNLEGEPV